MEHFRPIMEIVGTVVDAAGVLIVVVSALVSIGRQRTPNAYRQIPEDLGRAILLGLEFLVAGAIIPNRTSFHRWGQLRRTSGRAWLRNRFFQFAS